LYAVTPWVRSTAVECDRKDKLQSKPYQNLSASLNVNGFCIGPQLIMPAVLIAKFAALLGCRYPPFWAWKPQLSEPCAGTLVKLGEWQQQQQQ
jgi:hypothetical protein